MITLMTMRVHKEAGAAIPARAATLTAGIDEDVGEAISTEITFVGPEEVDVGANGAFMNEAKFLTMLPGPLN